MNMDKQAYKKYVKEHAPKSPLVKDILFAFLIGGLICAFGEGLIIIYENFLGLQEENASLLCSVSLIFLSVLLTSLGVFDKIAKRGGAGTLVPITGFANVVASSAIDSKNEGFILGLGSKIFSVAGPVLLYGVISGTIYGIIYYIFTLF